MGSTPVLLRNASDIYVSSKYPNTNTGTTWKYLHASADAGASLYMESLLYFGLPFPRGVTIISAKLRLTQHPAFTGTKTVNVARVGASFSATKVTWATKPASTGSVVTVAKTNSAAGTVWEWDVTALMQTVSSGAAWYGFRIYGTSVTSYPTRFYSSSADVIGTRPVLEVSWKDNPQKPTLLHPSDGRAVSLAKPIVQCDFTDYSGDTSLAAVQVRTFTSEANATAQTPIEFDSNEVATDVPELDLSTTAYAGVTDGASKWWRMRVKDGAGLWSPWSDPANFVRTTKGTLTMTNPSIATISDSTPPVTWTFTGRTQRAYEVYINSLTPSPVGSWTIRRQIWTSGKVTSTAQVLTIPTNVITSSTATYTLGIRVWDTIDRETTPNDPAYAEVTRDLTYVYSASTAPTTNLALTYDVYNHAYLTWNRSAMPDKYDIYRDGKVISTGDGDDYFVSGTSYTYIDRTPPPRQQATWKVVPIVNNLGSNTAQTISGTVTPKTLVLSDTAGNHPILIFNNRHDMQFLSTSAVHVPAGDGVPVLLTQSEHGYAGHIAGTLENNPLVPSLTSQQWRDRFENLTKNNGVTLMLIMVDRAFKCFIDKANVKPNVNETGVFYEVEFDFYQTDWSE